MVKTVAELIELLQRMPQDAEPRISYSFNYDGMEDDYDEIIECVEISQSEVYIGKHHEVIQPPQLTEEQKKEIERIIAERTAKTDSIIASLGMINVPKN